MKRALGIEVGRASVALCEVVLEGDGAPRRHRFARHVFAPDTAPPPEELADAALRLALELGVRERVAVLVLARELTWSKPVQLPPLPDPERLRLLALQPERFFPVSERRLVCDLEPGVNGALPVAHAAEAERLEEVVGALQSRGFRVSAVLPSAAALLRAATRGVPALTAGNWLLVRVEEDALTALAFHERTLRVSRRVEGFREHPDVACREVSRTARRAFEGAGALDQVRWPGWRDLPETVRATASASLAVPVHDLPEVPVESAALTAYGAALAATEDAPRPDLLPPSVRERRRQQSRWVTAACSALALLGALALLWSLGERQEARLRRFDAAIAAARAGAEDAAASRDSVLALEERIAAVQANLEQRAAWLRVPGRIGAALPDGAWIASLSIEEGGRVNLSGYAATASALIPALEATDVLTGVELAAPATRASVGTRELEAFNVRAVLAGSPADSARSAADRVLAGSAPGPAGSVP
ncbi:MAG: PilN domain-containing protein [Gemmatimonadota bacterium]